MWLKKRFVKKNKQPMLIIRIEEHPFVFAQLRKKDPKSAMHTFDKKTDLPGVGAFEDANGTKQFPSCDILSENAKLGGDWLQPWKQIVLIKLDHLLFFDLD